MGLNSSAVLVPGIGHFYIWKHATVTTKALSSNVATLTTSAAHGLVVGDSVTVAGVDSTFNGTFTLTAVTSTTLSYAKTASNVSSTAATGRVKASKPVGSAAPSAPWIEVGHTTYEDPLKIVRDGGDTTTLPTWQSPTGVRTTTTPVTFKLNFNLAQHDELAYQLYYGGGAINATTDEFEVPKTGTAVVASLFVRILDGAVAESRYIGTVDIIGSDDEEMDPEALAFLPVTATIVDDTDLSYLFTIANPQTVA
jgi:hypothetical protein